MYFVVYLIQPKVNVIVPHSWIKGYGAIVENFLNNGITSNHRFSAFWTCDGAAFNINGLPRPDYMPHENTSSFSQFPREGWYDGNIIRIRCMDNFFTGLFLGLFVNSASNLFVKLVPI